MVKNKIKAGRIFKFNNGVKNIEGCVAVTLEDACTVHDLVTRQHTKVLYSEYTDAQVTDITPEPGPGNGNGNGNGEVK